MKLAVALIALLGTILAAGVAAGWFRDGDTERGAEVTKVAIGETVTNEEFFKRRFQKVRQGRVVRTGYSATGYKGETLVLVFHMHDGKTGDRIPFGQGVWDDSGADNRAPIEVDAAKKSGITVSWVPLPNGPRTTYVLAALFQGDEELDYMESERFQVKPPSG